MVYAVVLLLDRNGDVYDGEWSAGKKEGVGVYTYKDGTKQEGVWVDDVRTDQQVDECL